MHVIKLRIVKWGDYPVLFGGGPLNVITSILIREGERFDYRRRRKSEH